MSDSLMIDEVVRLRKALRDLIQQAEDAAEELDSVGSPVAADALSMAIMDAKEAIHG